MSSAIGVELCDFGVRSRHPESARVFNAIVAGGLESSTGRSFLSELSGVAVVVLGWAAFLLFVFVPATQLIALCLCALALLLQRDEPAVGDDVIVGGARSSAAWAR